MIDQAFIEWQKRMPTVGSISKVQPFRQYSDDVFAPKVFSKPVVRNFLFSHYWHLTQALVNFIHN